MVRAETNIANGAQLSRENAEQISALVTLIHARPSWGVTAALTVLSSLVVGLATALVAGAHV